MYAPSKMTDTEWANVEYISKEFAYWRRDHPVSLAYSISPQHMTQLIAVINRLDKCDNLDLKIGLRGPWCFDCGLTYPFPDYILPDEIWKSIAPVNGEGLLCPTCIAKRLDAKNIWYGQGWFKPQGCNNFDLRCSSCQEEKKKEDT